jgi:hypothetical protein
VLIYSLIRSQGVVLEVFWRCGTALSRNPNVTNVEIVKAARMMIQIPVTCHSRVRSGSWLAISQSARNKEIIAKTERNPRIAEIIADNLKHFIFKILSEFDKFVIMINLFRYG